MRFSSVFINHTQDSQTPSLDCRIMDEIPRPDMASVLGLCGMPPSRDPTAALLLLWWRNLKTFLATHLANSFAADTQSTITNQSTHLIRTKLGMLQAKAQQWLRQLPLSSEMGTSDDNARWIGAGESSWRPCADCTVYLRQRAAHSLDGAPRLQLFF